MNSRVISIENSLKISMSNVTCNIIYNTFINDQIGGFLKISNVLNIYLYYVNLYSTFCSKTTVGIIIVDNNEILTSLGQAMNFMEDMNVIQNF